jgi:hypothetical protein
MSGDLRAPSIDIPNGTLAVSNFIHFELKSRYDIFNLI